MYKKKYVLDDKHFYAFIRKPVLVMKLTCVLMITVCMQVSFAAKAQRISLSEKNTSIGQIFKKINQHFGYEFICTEEMLKEAHPVSIHVKEATIAYVLEKCFDGQPLTYKIDDNTIIVRRKIATKQPPSIKNIKVSGIVTDEQGMPLPGAGIKVKGGDRRAVADKDGRYVIEVQGNSILVFTYLG